MLVFSREGASHPGPDPVCCVFGNNWSAELSVLIPGQFITVEGKIYTIDFSITLEECKLTRHDHTNAVTSSSE